MTPLLDHTPHTHTNGYCDHTCRPFSDLLVLHAVMIEYQLFDQGLPRRQRHNEQVSEVTIPRPAPSRHRPFPVYLNASTGTVISSINGTLIIHLRPHAYNSKSVYVNSNLAAVHNTTTTNNNNLSTSTLSYEELSREFYQTYDPSVGLHTAAVLGGILVWLVLYLIYKTQVRKCIVHVIKKIFGDGQELSIAITSSDGEKDCSSENNNSFIRNLVNPSIVIEASPPESQPQSPFAHDQYNPDGQDCLSPYSLPGSGHEDGMIFKFPSPDQEQCQCHSPCCLDPQELLRHLPKSEMDIRSATAQWVQNMPLAARSQQDFAGLMMSLRSHGLLAMNKPCSCPLVCPRTPHPLSLLDLPHTWNNSLPVLSNSLSSQILSAYEAVINQAKENDIKNLLNTTRKFKSHKDRSDNCKNNVTEYTPLIEKNDKENVAPLRRHSHVGHRCDKNRRSNLGETTCSHENSRLLNKFACAHFPRPIPVTPTVMIQSSNPACRHYKSNTSISSSSSADPLLAPHQSPYIHMSRPTASHLPSPHLLSPVCHSRSRHGSKHLSRSNVDLSGNQRQETIRSRSVSPHRCGINHEACSFKYKGGRKPSDTSSHSSKYNCVLSHHRSLGGSNNSLTAAGHAHCNTGRLLSQQCRSFSDSNCGMNDPKNQSHGQLNPRFVLPNYQGSLSADVIFSMNRQREHGSPTFSNESNRTSLGTSSRSPTPSPHLLQVPDPHNLFRPVTPDTGISKKYYTDLSPNGPHPGMRHCVHSDGNIAYHTGHHLPVISQMDNSTLRRHSTFSTGPEEISLSLCCDNTVRPSSSLGSSGTHGSSHHHPHLPRPDRHLPRPDKHQPHSHHQSTGMLRPDNSRRPACGLFPQTNLNRSYSAVMMETKL